MKNNRRDFLKTAAVLSLGAATNISKAEHILDIENITGPKFSLPPLGYNATDLEPFIDGQTMLIHHDMHHQAYVNKLNDAVDNEPTLKGKTLEELLKNIESIPESSRNVIRNNAGGHWNHSFFWPLLKKGTSPGKTTTALMQVSFGMIENFKIQFENNAMSVFGSGWTWLLFDKKTGKLKIANTPNQDNPLMDISNMEGKPVLALDVWEHAYYLKNQNRRKDYIQNFWNVVNWDKVEELIKA
jgi:Fe-Mn family superoxide dismutase